MSSLMKDLTDEGYVCLECNKLYYYKKEVCMFICSNCNRLNCLICHTSHDAACEMFGQVIPQQHPPELAPVASNPNMISQNHLPFPDADQIRVSRRARRPSTLYDHVKLSKRRKTGNFDRDNSFTTDRDRAKSMPAIQSKRVFCQICLCEIARCYQSAHNKTKKHLKNLKTVKTIKKEKIVCEVELRQHQSATTIVGFDDEI